MFDIPVVVFDVIHLADVTLTAEGAFVSEMHLNTWNLVFIAIPKRTATSLFLKPSPQKWVVEGKRFCFRLVKTFPCVAAYMSSLAIIAIAIDRSVQ